MKKILLLISCLGVILISSSFASSTLSSSTSEIKSTVSASDYSFVGQFTFYATSYNTKTVEVYEASNACGSYYAKVGDKYYKMFSGEQTFTDGQRVTRTYNYYFVLNGNKWWTKI